MSDVKIAGQAVGTVGPSTAQPAQVDKGAGAGPARPAQLGDRVAVGGEPAAKPAATPELAVQSGGNPFAALPGRDIPFESLRLSERAVDLGQAVELPFEALQKLAAAEGKLGPEHAEVFSKLREGVMLLTVDAQSARAGSALQLEDLGKIAGKLAQSGEPPTTKELTGMLLAPRPPGALPIDINAFVQQVLRESYLMQCDLLRDYADKVKFYNELKKKIRAEVQWARGEAARYAGLDDDAPLAQAIKPAAIDMTYYGAESAATGGTEQARPGRTTESVSELASAMGRTPAEMQFTLARLVQARFRGVRLANSLHPGLPASLLGSALRANAASAAVLEGFGTKLNNLAADKSKFHALMRTVYGDGYDVQQAESLRRRTLAGDVSWLPPIRWVGEQTLPAGANGAYDSQNNVVYLNERLFADPELAVTTYAEEFGHSLDIKLNASDTLGDEGELFRRLFAGETLSSSEVAAIGSESDVGIIFVDGKPVRVEFFLDAIGGAISGAVSAIAGTAGSVLGGAFGGIGGLMGSFSGGSGQGGSSAVDTLVDTLKDLAGGGGQPAGEPNTRPSQGAGDGWQPGQDMKTKADLSAYIESLEEKLNTAGDDSQLANVDLQNALQRQQQTLQMMSNMSKMLHDTAMSIIRKIGG